MVTTFPVVKDFTAHSVSSKEVYATLAAIEAWPYWSEIQQIAQREYGLTPSQFSELLPEYQKFMALAKHTPSLGMCSEQVDKIWHAHYLHGRRYEQFSHDLLGRFVYHIPNLEVSSSSDVCSNVPCATVCKTPPPQCTDKLTSTSPVPDFRSVYQQHFGELPSVWNCSVFDGVAS